MIRRRSRPVLARDHIPIYLMSDSGIPGFQISEFEHFSVSYTRKVKNGFPPHRHRYFEVFWFTEGEGLALFDSQRPVLKPMTLYFINPGEVHNFFNTRNMRGYLMQFTPEFISTLDTVLPEPLAPTFWRPHSHPVLSLNPAEQNIINPIFANIVHETKSADDQKDSVIKAHLFLFFNKVRQFYQSRSAAAAKPSESILTRRFQEIVRTRCPPLVTVKQFADALGVSRSRLHRAVSGDTGRTPSAIIHERLMVEAKRQLLHTSSGLGEIARWLGFCDPSYFGRFFRRHATMSPHRFRRHQRAAAA